MRFSSSCSVSASVFFCQANLASAAALAMLTQYWRAALVWRGGGSAGLGARGDVVAESTVAGFGCCAANCAGAMKASIAGLGARLAVVARLGGTASTAATTVSQPCWAKAGEVPMAARTLAPTMPSDAARTTVATIRPSLAGAGLIAPPGPPAARRPT